MTQVTHQQARPLARPAAALVWLLVIGVPAGMLTLVAAGPTPEQDAWAIPLLVPLLFPDGRLMSRRWAVVAALLLFSAAATLIGTVIKPGPLEGMPDFDNPVGMPALGGLAQALIDLGGLGALVCIPAGVVAAVLRYRRGTPVERKQLKWFGSVLVLAFAMFFAATVLPQPYGQWAWIVASASIALVPVAIGIAILRYRLYEIDRIVSRTIGWALVTGLLLGVFAGTIVGLQALLAPFTNNNTLAVAASTHLAALRGRLVRVASEAVHPNGAGLWLRSASEPER